MRVTNADERQELMIKWEENSDHEDDNNNLKRLLRDAGTRGNC